MRNIWVNSSLPKNPLAVQWLRHRSYRPKWLKYKWSSWACLLLIGLFIPVLTACMGTTPPLRVGTTAGIVSDHLYLAKELEYFNDASIRLIDYPTADDQLRAFRNKQLDVTAVPLSDALILAQTNSDIRGILVLSRSEGEDILVANRSITQLEDLAGKSIGVEASSRSRLTLAQALDWAKISNQNVEVVSLPLADQLRAFEQEEVAAVVTHEPARSSLLASGGHYMFPETNRDSVMFSILLVNEETLRQRKRQLIDLSQGYLLANDYASNHQQESLERLAKRHHLSPELMNQVKKAVDVFDLDDNQRLLKSGDQELAHQVKRLGRQLQQQQLLNGFIDPKLTLDDGIVNQIKG